ncbi:hypothetical protein JCM11251_007839, partial [Rhodosporidiobolus azoricus]
PTGTGLNTALKQILGAVASNGGILQGEVGTGLDQALDNVVDNVAARA